MSGVAKDDKTPSSASDETVTATEAVDAESVETNPTSDEPRGRRGAPHLRVVGEDGDFATPSAADAPHQRIGAVMKATREGLGYSLEQVSKETRVHLSHLRAIEDMTPNLLGAPVYAKGYIRAYARHLGMDEMGTLDRYLRECAILKDPEKQDIAPPTAGRRLPTAVPVLGFLVLALAGAVGAYFVISGKRPEAAAAGSTAAARPDPAVQAPGGILAESSADVAVTGPVLEIVAVKPGHLEVRTAAGDKMIDRDLLPGERRIPRVGSNWTVSASDGSAFEWRLGNQSLGLMKPDGGPVFSQSVDMAAQRMPVVVEPPVVASEPAPVEAAPSTSAPPPSTTNASTAPAQPKPKPETPPRPRQQAPATPPAVAAAPPPVTASSPPPAAQTPTTPPRDPALAAYPDQ